MFGTTGTAPSNPLSFNSSTNAATNNAFLGGTNAPTNSTNPLFGSNKPTTGLLSGMTNNLGGSTSLLGNTQNQPPKGITANSPGLFNIPTPTANIGNNIFSNNTSTTGGGPGLFNTNKPAVTAPNTANTTNTANIGDPLAFLKNNKTTNPQPNTGGLGLFNSNQPTTTTPNTTAANTTTANTNTTIPGMSDKSAPNFLKPLPRNPQAATTSTNQLSSNSTPNPITTVGTAPNMPTNTTNTISAPTPTNNLLTGNNQAATTNPLGTSAPNNTFTSNQGTPQASNPLTPQNTAGNTSVPNAGTSFLTGKQTTNLLLTNLTGSKPATTPGNNPQTATTNPQTAPTASTTGVLGTNMFNANNTANTNKSPTAPNLFNQGTQNTGFQNTSMQVQGAQTTTPTPQSPNSQTQNQNMLNQNVQQQNASQNTTQNMQPQNTQGQNVQPQNIQTQNFQAQSAQNQNQNTQNQGFAASNSTTPNANLGQNAANAAINQQKDQADIQFERSNQTVAQFIDDFRKTFLQSYNDLQKLSDSTIKYLAEKEENQRIVKNFDLLEPMIKSKSSSVSKTLDTIQQQQTEIEKALTMMEKRLGDGIEQHQLTKHLLQYELMKGQVYRLSKHSDRGSWNDSSHEQLAIFFETLNGIQLQIREMNQKVDRYLTSLSGYL